MTFVRLRDLLTLPMSVLQRLHANQCIHSQLAEMEAWKQSYGRSRYGGTNRGGMVEGSTYQITAKEAKGMWQPRHPCQPVTH